MFSTDSPDVGQNEDTEHTAGTDMPASGQYVDGRQGDMVELPSAHTKPGWHAPVGADKPDALQYWPGKQANADDKPGKSEKQLRQYAS
jgi:hypothetical protein